MYNLTKSGVLYSIFILFISINSYSQVTPPNADSDAECGADCYDIFNWTPVADPAGNVLGGEGFAEDSGCSTTIEGFVEYTGVNNPDLSGSSVGTTASNGDTDNWQFTFGTALTNPVINLGALQTDSEVTIKDCNGAIIAATCINSCATSLTGPPWTGDSGYSLQLNGTFSCFEVCVSVFRNDFYTISIGTCLANIPPPPCTVCPAGDFEFINLDQTGSLPNPQNPNLPLPVGIVEVDGICFGQYEFIYGDIANNLDGNGTTFGVWDTDGGTGIIRVDFCRPIDIQQIEIYGLEVESMAEIGTSIAGTGAGASLSGLNLTFCGGNNRVNNMNITGGDKITTGGSGCRVQANGMYTVAGGNNVSTMYFKYMNPPGGCMGDYAGFRVGVCNAPPVASAVPVCPVEVQRIACVGPLGNFGSARNVLVDGLGRIFNGTQCGSNIPAADGSGNVDMRVAVENGIALETFDIGCSDIVEIVGECNFDCADAPACAATSCPVNQEFRNIVLDRTGTNAAGLPTGVIRLNGAKAGTYEFVFSDVDVSLDGNGSTFGFFDNDGGTGIVCLNFCTPINVQEIFIRGLEVMSEVTIGTNLVGTGASATVSGLNLTNCFNPSGRMGVGPGSNEVITDGPGCSANPNGAYTIAPSTVSTLYFKYQNPVGGCSFDYVGFRVGACVPTLEEVVPECQLDFFQLVECPGDSPRNVVRDRQGRWFNAPSSCPSMEFTTPMQQIDVRCMESLTPLECNPCCELEVTCPTNNNIGPFDCNRPVPACPTTVNQLRAAPYNITIGNDPCGTIRFTCTDSAIPIVCAAANQTITRTFVIFDDLNNDGVRNIDEEFEICAFTYNFLADLTDPVINCPANRTVECSSPNTPPATGVASATDNCTANNNIIITWSDVSTQATAGCGQYEFVITRTWVAEDMCGNTSDCVQVINIVDTTPPALTCIDITVDLDGSGNISVPVELVSNVNDNCSENNEINVAGTPLDFNCADLFQNPDFCSTGFPVTVTATDICGNISVCVALVTVQDTIAPTVFCPSSRVIPLEEGQCGQFTDQQLPTFFDNCSARLDTIDAPARDAFFELNCDTRETDPILYSYEIVDPCGNTTPCAFEVTYIESPIGAAGNNQLRCNDHVNVTVDENCMIQFNADMLLEGDNFGCFDCFVLTPEVIFSNDIVGNKVDVSVTDPISGNSCWSSIVVEDKNDPTLSCDVCTNPTVSDPDCVLNCTEEKVFREFVDLGNGNGRIGLDEGLLSLIHI